MAEAKLEQVQAASDTFYRMYQDAQRDINGVHDLLDLLSIPGNRETNIIARMGILLKSGV